MDIQRRLETSIGRILRAGVVISAVFLSAGWALLATGQQSGEQVMGTGIRVLMSTPVLRVAATFVLFVRQRDATYAAITAAVLALLGSASSVGFICEEATGAAVPAES